MSNPMGPGDCPYVGLEPFEAEHERYFFGRRQDSKILADHVRARKLTVFYGASGTGKTSVLNVGLRTELRTSGMTIAILRDWQDPKNLDRLAVAAVFAALSEEQRAALPPRLRDPKTRPEFIRFIVGMLKRPHGSQAAVKRPRQPLLLILDQFEEYFLYRNLYRNRDQMRAIEVAIGKLVARTDFPFHVVLSMRDDGLHHLDDLRAFVPGILDTTVRLDHLNDAGVAEAIRGPVKQYNKDYREGREPIVVEDKLVARLIEQLKQAEPGLGKGDAAAAVARPIELSYLQLALMKLWDAEDGPNATALRERTLTNTLGGVRQIVRDHIRRVMERLSPGEQQLCARIFDRLVTGIGSKVAYPTKALAAEEVAGPGVDEETVKQVLLKLTPKDSRILKTVYTNGLPGFELFHDVLGLPILEWMRASRAETRRQEEIAAATAAAEQQRRDELTQAEQRKKEELAQAEQRKQQELAAADKRRQDELAAAQASRLTLFRYAAALFAVLFLFALYQTIDAYRQAALLSEELKRTTAAIERADAEKNSRIRADGLALWSKLSLGSDALTREEVEALWEIATATGLKRDGFMAPLLSNPADGSIVTILGRRPAPVLRALGLDWPLSSEAERVRDNILRTRIVEPEPLLARAKVVSALTTMPLSPAQSLLGLEPILSAMRRIVQQAGNLDVQMLLVDLTEQRRIPAERPGPSKGPKQDQPQDEATKRQEAKKKIADELEKRLKDMASLTGALRELPETTALQQTLSTLEVVMELVATTSNENIHTRLVSAGAALVQRLDADQRQAAVGLGLRLLGDALGPEARSAVAGWIARSTAKLDADQSQSLLNSIVDMLTRGDNPRTMFALAEILERLGMALTPDQQRDVLQSIVNTLAGADTEALEFSYRALRTIDRRISSAQSLSAITPILDALTKATDAGSIRALARMLRTLSAIPSDEQIGQALEHILKTLEATEDDNVVALAEAVQALSARLNAEQAETAIKALLQKTDNKRDADAVRALFDAAMPLVQKLDPTRARAVLSQVLMMLKSPADRLLGGLNNMLLELRVLPTPDETRAALASILSTLSQSKNPSLPAQVRLIGTLARTLAIEDAQAELDRSLQQLASASDQDAATGLARAAPALASRVSGPPAQIFAERIIEALARLASDSTLLTLVQTLKSLNVELTVAQMERAATPLLEALKRVEAGPGRTPDQALSMQTLGDAVRSLPGTLTPAQMQALLDPILSGLAWATGPASNVLARSLEDLSGRLDDSQASVVLAAALLAIEKAESYSTIRALTRAARSSAAMLGSEQRDRMLGPARVSLSNARLEDAAEAFARIVVELSRLQPNERYLYTITDTLKYPTVVGDALDPITGALRPRFPDAPPDDELNPIVIWLQDRLGREAVASAPKRPSLQ